MPTGSYTATVQRYYAIAADGAISQFTLTGPENPRISVVLPVGKAGVLTTRTNDTVGVITSAGHGLTGSETIAVFWDDPTTGDPKRCYRCTLTGGTGVGDTIGFTAAAGDVLPVATTAVQFGVAQNINLEATIDSTVLLALVIKTTNITEYGLCELFSDNGTSDPISELVADVYDNKCYGWPVEETDAAPYSGIIDELDFYNGSLVAGVGYVWALLS